MFVEVALPVPQLKTLTYSYSGAQSMESGMRVVVPLGKRTHTGVVIATSKHLPENVAKLRPIVRVLDEKPALSQELMKFGRWIADYYECTWGEALAAMLPVYAPTRGAEYLSLQAPLAVAPLCRGLAAKLLARLAAGPCLRSELLQGLSAGAASALLALKRRGVVVSRQETMRAQPRTDKQKRPLFQDVPPELNAFQMTAMRALTPALQEKKYTPFLLHGVTGSGKTEIYLRALQQILNQGQSAIVLVPEISLTPQLRTRLLARLDAQVEVWHSGLTPKERYAVWQNVRQGRARVVLGARSAIFAPLQNLGLIVVDEEYEGSYKQEETPRYHARNIAMVRAQAEKATLILGTATPSMETYYNALQGKLSLLELPQRADGKELPEVYLVDMSQEVSQEGRLPILSQKLLQALEARLRAGEQSILFLNRRGYAPLVLCPACGHVLTCPDCSVSLVYHQQQDRLLCHTCGKSRAARPACPKCGIPCVRLAGAGTQRVEAELKKYFPQARLVRIDQDISRQRGALEQGLEKFETGEGDILVGTQMVAKGMDFPNVTLVGIVSADTALHLPDFRAEERTFQLLVQVAGRAGRGGKPGLVLAQTLNPKHPTMVLAQKQDYKGFFRRELEQRQNLFYPPFARLASVVCQSRNQDAAFMFACQAVEVMRKVAGKKDMLLGPVPSPRARVAKMNRFQMLVKSGTHTARKRILESLKSLRPVSGVRMTIDVDPQNML